MSIDTAVENLKVFRKWFGGAGKKYMYSMPEGTTRDQISESLKTVIDFIPNILPLDEFCRVTAAAGAHMTRFKKNRKEVIKGMSDDEKKDFDSYIANLSKSVRDAEKIIRRLQKMEGTTKDK